MRTRHIQPMRRVLFVLVALVWAVIGWTSNAAASATLLLEEPYGKMGFFTATGHAAVYLSGVCAQTPIELRPCAPGEQGIVVSRYDRVGGYDWVAIPLIPYLYAVERPEDVPLFADAKMVSFLRDRYRQRYLEEIAPDRADGESPSGNWYELVGSSYDRTIYGFEIETTPEQDLALIRKYNASRNHSHFSLVARNCADFAKDVVNFYYPKALHRSVISDVGMTTPKQISKMLVRFSGRHPELQFSRLVIPQVPGSMPRSSAVHGVVESFFKSKKYIVPSAIVSPIFAGSVVAVYLGTGSGGFDPAKHALVFTPGGELELPAGRDDRLAYQRELKGLLAGSQSHTFSLSIDKRWGRQQAHAQPEVDDQGRPVLRLRVGEQIVSVGASAGNVLSSGAPPALRQELLEARLQAELRPGKAPRVSEIDLARDWGLLQEVRSEPLSASLRQQGATRLESERGNRP